MYCNYSIKYIRAAAAAAKSLQLCPTLCDPIDGSPPGSPVPVILQARTMEQVAISFPNAWKWKVKVKSLSRVRLFATPWTAANQAPPSLGFSRQKHWSGLPFPSPTHMPGGQKKKNKTRRRIVISSVKTFQNGPCQKNLLRKWRDNFLQYFLPLSWIQMCEMDFCVKGIL